MADLSDFVVTAHLRDRGWEAEIRRKDGKEMRVEGATKLTFTTMMAQSSGEAIRFCQRAGFKRGGRCAPQSCADDAETVPHLSF
jgi:hypothetical protein